MNCPFCDESDFDNIGLKFHLDKGYCDIYNETENTTSIFDLCKRAPEDPWKEVGHLRGRSAE